MPGALQKFLITNQETRHRDTVDDEVYEHIKSYHSMKSLNYNHDQRISIVKVD